MHVLSFRHISFIQVSSWASSMSRLVAMLECVSQVKINLYPMGAVLQIC